MKNTSHFPPLTFQLTIGWLYPELMSTYGDRGNVMVLQKRAEWRGINLKVERINQTSHLSLLTSSDLLFMGGAQDIQQEIVNKDLIENKGERLAEMIENNIPSLFICGAYQFLGKYYKDSYGTKIKGLGIFDMYTESIPDKPRLIGNIVIKPKLFETNHQPLTRPERSRRVPIPYLTGFENHGGRTYLGNKNQAFAEVLKGNGNNGEDKTEGIHYKNAIGTYLHGPILPSNPELADYLIEKALIRKYEKAVTFSKTDDSFSEKAKLTILKRLKASY